MICGMSALVIALMLNNYLLGFLFAPDGNIEFPNSALVIFFQFCLGIWGILVILTIGKNSKALSFLFGIALSVLILFLTEFGIYLFQATVNSKNCKIEVPSMYVYDQNIGYRLKSNSMIHAKRIIDGDTVFDVIYKINKDGRRIVPQDSIIQREKFLLMLGGSYVFGEGLNDNQTTSYYLQSRLEDYEVYNFGLGGYGTNQVHALLHTDSLGKEITQNSGFGIYVFMDDHVYRNIGSMSHYNLWGKNMPYYFLKGDSLMRAGSFTTGRKFRSFIYNFLGKSYLLKVFHFDWPSEVGAEDIRLTARLIEASAKEFKRQFPQGRFVVVFYPGSVFSSSLIKILEEDAVGIVLLDYLKLFDRSNQKYIIRLDEHPSPLANEVLSQNLIKDLELVNN